MAEPGKGKALDDDGYCFACGRHNPHGLGMRVQLDASDLSATCRIALDKRFQGWAGIAHGGVVATLLDEIMAHAVIRHLGQAVTTGMETTFRAPVPLEREVVVRGWVAEDKGRMCVTQATIHLEGEQRPLAQAKARFLMRNRGQ